MKVLRTIGLALIYFIGAVLVAGVFWISIGGPQFEWVKLIEAAGHLLMSFIRSN